MTRMNNQNENDNAIDRSNKPSFLPCTGLKGIADDNLQGEWLMMNATDDDEASARMLIDAAAFVINILYIFAALYIQELGKVDNTMKHQKISPFLSQLLLSFIIVSSRRASSSSSSIIHHHHRHSSSKNLHWPRQRSPRGKIMP